MSIRWEQGQLELTARLWWSTGFSGGRGDTGETAHNRHGKTRDELVSTRRTISPASQNYKRDFRQQVPHTHTIRHRRASCCLVSLGRWSVLVSQCAASIGLMGLFNLTLVDPWIDWFLTDVRKRHAVLLLRLFMFLDLNCWYWGD